MGELTRLILAAFLCVATSAGAMAAMPNNRVTDDAAVLNSRRSTTAAKIASCANLAGVLTERTNRATTPVRNGAADRAFSMLETFERSGVDVPARVTCARRIVTLTTLVLNYPGTVRVSSAYGPQSIALVRGLLDDPNAVMREGAAKALWGVHDAGVGRALLRKAQSDPSDAVRAAAFDKMFWAMNADVRQNSDAAIYDTAILHAITVERDTVVAAALSAYAGLHAFDADALLRRYAVDKRPKVRAGAIAAYDAMMGYNPSIEHFIESRLDDRDAEVRSEVLLRLLRMGDTHALPAIDRLAKTAPRADERKEAQEYATAIRRDASGKSF